MDDCSQTLSGDPLKRLLSVLLASDAKVEMVRKTWKGSYCLLRSVVMSQGSLYTPASMFLKSCQPVVRTCQCCLFEREQVYIRLLFAQGFPSDMQHPM